jgi:hypothetical protein
MAMALMTMTLIVCILLRLYLRVKSPETERTLIRNDVSKNSEIYIYNARSGFVSRNAMLSTLLTA